MAIHLNFPRSPYAVLPPERRGFPAAQELRDAAYEKLWPPLVANPHDYALAVKVIDIFGNGPMTLVPVKVG